MQKILAKKTVSMTDMRDPKKVLEFAAGEPVAVMNRNKVISYFIPEERYRSWIEEHDLYHLLEKP